MQISIPRIEKKSASGEMTVKMPMKYKEQRRSASGDMLVTIPKKFAKCQ